VSEAFQTVRYFYNWRKPSIGENFCNVHSATTNLLRALRPHILASVEEITSKYFKINLCSQKMLAPMELTAVTQTNLLHQSINYPAVRPLWQSHNVSYLEVYSCRLYASIFNSWIWANKFWFTLLWWFWDNCTNCCLYRMCFPHDWTICRFCELK